MDIYALISFVFRIFRTTVKLCEFTDTDLNSRTQGYVQNQSFQLKLFT